MKKIFIFLVLALSSSVSFGYAQCKWASVLGEVVQGQGADRYAAIEDTVFNCLASGQWVESACNDRARIRCH